LCGCANGDIATVFHKFHVVVEMYSSRCTATLQGRDWFTAGGNTTVMGTLLGITVSTVLARLFVNVNLYSLSSQK